MSDYKYALIDANYILRRNTEAIFKGLGASITCTDIIKSFNQSIRKLQREVHFDIPVLLFDKAPYKKSEAFPAYKGDRVYITEEYIKQYLEEHNYEVSHTELMNLYSQAAKNKESMIAKYTIIKKPESGWKTYIKQGYEADDLAYILAKKLEGKDFHNILISSDSDWVTFTTDNTDYCTLKLDHKEDARDRWFDMSFDYEIPMYDLGLMNELYYYSHNNIDVYKEIHPEVSFETFCHSLYDSNDSIPDYETYKSYYDAMNMNQWVDDIEVDLE